MHFVKNNKELGTELMIDDDLDSGNLFIYKRIKDVSSYTNGENLKILYEKIKAGKIRNTYESFNFTLDSDGYFVKHKSVFLEESHNFIKTKTDVKNLLIDVSDLMCVYFEFLDFIVIDSLI